MEHALHAIWQRVLDRQDIDSNASFFALGGTSLDTIRVKGDIKRQLGLRLILPISLSTQRSRR